MKIMFSCIHFPIWPYPPEIMTIFLYTGKLYGLTGMVCPLWDSREHVSVKICRVNHCETPESMPLSESGESPCETPESMSLSESGESTTVRLQRACLCQNLECQPLWDSREYAPVRIQKDPLWDSREHVPVRIQRDSLWDSWTPLLESRVIPCGTPDVHMPLLVSGEPSNVRPQRVCPC